MVTTEYSPAKLQELIVYVAEKSAGDRFFGGTKLNKILFFSDFTAYRKTGASITGAVYQHLPQGPCPHQLLPALTSLGDAVVQKQESTYAYTRKRPIATRRADLSLFEVHELTIVDEVLAELELLNASQVSEYSHKTMAWRLTSDHQEIPYGTAYLDSEEPLEEDLTWLKEVASNVDAGVASSTQ